MKKTITGNESQFKEIDKFVKDHGMKVSPFMVLATLEKMVRIEEQEKSLEFYDHSNSDQLRKENRERLAKLELLLDIKAEKTKWKKTK